MVSGPISEHVTFTAEDALAVARHLQEFPAVVLVGGQSLNFWAEQFRANTPELDKLAPFQSGDVDFLGSIPDVEACAKRLGGTVRYPDQTQVNTPEVGVVHCIVNGKELKIDFLAYLAGLKSSQVRKTAIEADVQGVVLRVMHPINVVISRVANVVQLRRSDPLALRQTLVSLHVVAAFIRRAAAEDARQTLTMIEEIFKIAMSRDGIRIWHRFDIDTFATIQPFPGLPAAFGKTRLPQMITILSDARQRYKGSQDRHAARKLKSRGGARLGQL